MLCEKNFQQQLKSVEVGRLLIKEMAAHYNLKKDKDFPRKENPACIYLCNKEMVDLNIFTKDHVTHVLCRLGTCLTTTLQYMSLVMRNKIFAYAKTKTQISFAVTVKLISAFVFAT